MFIKLIVLNFLVFSIILKIIITSKITESISNDNQKNNHDINFDKMIMTPPFLPRPDFLNEVDNQKLEGKFNENFNNFRFKSMIINL